MELKFFIGPIISFVMALIAFVPLVKYRLKSTEEATEKQRQDIQKNKDDNHRLELLISENEKNSNSKSMNKLADALHLVAESNSKFQSILETQTVLIQKANEASDRAHYRLDSHIKEVTTELNTIREKYVSHPFLKEALKQAP